MKQYSKFIQVLIAVVLISSTAVAQDLISAKDLAKKLNNKDYVVVCAQKPDLYKQVHIKGAINIYHKDLYKTSGPGGMLMSTSELAAYFGKKGVSADKTIVVYDGGSSKYAGRLYWVFKYMGADNVYMLDGHMKSWKSARKPITRNPTNLKATTFTADVQADYLATMADVKNADVVVDVRSEGEFTGSASNSTGHIPGAVHIHFEEVLNEDGTMKSADELKSIFNAAGVTSDKEVVLYCKTSVRAGVMFLALKSVLNYPNVKVYDGAYNEWVDQSNKVSKS